MVISRPPGLKSTQSFIEMIQSAKGSTLDDDLDDEETFLLKKETPSPVHKGGVRVWKTLICKTKVVLFVPCVCRSCMFVELSTFSYPSFPGELRVKIDGKSSDQKPNTPRSKHSATEQRRRSKINDRHALTDFHLENLRTFSSNRLVFNVVDVLLQVKFQ